MADTSLIPQQALDLNVLEQLEFDLPAKLNNLASLEAFEQQVFIAFGDVERAWDDVSRAYTRAAYHIHMILEHQLWRHRQTKGEDGQEYSMYNYQEDYLADLAQNTLKGFKVSTVKQFHSTIRMYKAMGWSRQQIEEATIRVLNKVSKRVEKDYVTGAPMGYKDGKVPEGKDLVTHLNEVTQEVIKRIDAPDIVFTNRDLDIHLDQQLANRKPMIDFRRLYGRPMTEVQWAYELTDDAGQLTPSKYGILRLYWEGDPPESVKIALLNKLGINLD